MFVRWKAHVDWHTKYMYSRNRKTDGVSCSGKTKEFAVLFPSQLLLG